MNLSYIKGKRFEIKILGDELTISFKGHYDPLDKLSNALITYKFEEPLKEDYIVISSNGKTSLDDLYLFSLDNSKEAITLNFEDDPNNATVWVVKPDFDPSKVYKEEIVEPEDNKKGCKSSLSLVFALPALITLTGVLVLKKKEER